MTDNYHTPAFNLKAVVQETNLKPDTLRAWERRYGMPQPGRTDGGHRVYSQYDIDVLNWLSARQDEGLSISRAVKLWRQMEAEGRNPLLTMETAVSSTSAATAALSGQSMEQLREGWINACLEFDERTARHILAQAFAIFTVETVCFELLQRGLAQIGNGWYEGTVSVQQEHFASALALRQMEALLAATPEPTKHGRILVACPPDEQHTFSPLLFTLLIKRAGWDVVYLGANVPADRLQAAIEPIRPDLLVLISQTLMSAGNLLDIANDSVKQDIVVAYGGAVFNTNPAVRDRVPGHFLGETLETSVKAVSRLIGSTATTTKKRPSPTYIAALNHYNMRRSAVEEHVLSRTPDDSVALDQLRIATTQLSKNIVAALKLGDMNLLTPDIEWMQGLLISFPDQITRDILAGFLALYQEAVTTHMDDRGRPITAWFSRILQN